MRFGNVRPTSAGPALRQGPEPDSLCQRTFRRNVAFQATASSSSITDHNVKSDHSYEKTEVSKVI